MCRDATQVRAVDVFGDAGSVGVVLQVVGKPFDVEALPGVVDEVAGAEAVLVIKSRSRASRALRSDHRSRRGWLSPMSFTGFRRQMVDRQRMEP